MTGLGGSWVDAQDATDRAAPDRLPACPGCGDLNEPRALNCESCGTRLYLINRELPGWEKR
jgi:hypothetical protein